MRDWIERVLTVVSKKISTRKFLFFDLTNITLFARPLQQGAERVSLRVMSG
jgi:hypothetical protein